MLNNIVVAAISSINHSVGLHFITFTPSSGPKGSRLKKASIAFIKHINPTVCHSMVSSVSRKENIRKLVNAMIV
ncbi:MAG: hypothetical protein R6V26_00005, partial [Roseovarius sp.]